MLEKRAEKLLEYMNALSGGGKYAVVDRSRILAAFPQEFSENDAVLDKTVKTLDGAGYIKLIYGDGESYCFTSTEKGESYKETLLKEDGENKIPEKYIFCRCFFSALIGGFIGATAACAFFLIAGGYA